MEINPGDATALRALSSRLPFRLLAHAGEEVLSGLLPDRRHRLLAHAGEEVLQR
jgi:hypothetical protein